MNVSDHVDGVTEIQVVEVSKHIFRVCPAKYMTTWCAKGDDGRDFEGEEMVRLAQLIASNTASIIDQ